MLKQAILPYFSEAEWQHKNPMPYKYLEKVLSSTLNNLFVGKIGEEICSVFSFSYTE